ncbi:MAG: iron chelate uptake ABC transporter family permease subunit, partial [Egibacteraceae bacterium]
MTIRAWVWLALLGLIAVTCVAALSLGTPTIPPARFASVLSGQPGDRTAEIARLVLRELRIPRVLLGLVAGASLGCAGLVLQEALRNPLAVPDLVGVSSGASLAVALTVVTGVSLPLGALPSVALAGGLAGGLLTLVAARRARSPDAV